MGFQVEFQGFGEHAVEFFDELAADNSKAFWTDNKQLYQAHVRQPMEALLAELTDEFAAAFDGTTGRAKVFRPHRDLRFSGDKRPYKEQCGAVIEPGRGAGAFYLQVSSAGLMIGGGSFRMAPDQLARFRTAVADPRRGGELAVLLDAARSRGWTLGGDVLKSRPRGVAADHPRLELLKHRTLYLAKYWPPDDALHDRETLHRVRHGWRDLVALNEWTVRHVGFAG